MQQKTQTIIQSMNAMYLAIRIVTNIKEINIKMAQS